MKKFFRNMAVAFAGCLLLTIGTIVAVHLSPEKEKHSMIYIQTDERDNFRSCFRLDAIVAIVSIADAHQKPQGVKCVLNNNMEFDVVKEKEIKGVFQWFFQMNGIEIDEEEIDKVVKSLTPGDGNETRSNANRQ